MRLLGILAALTLVGCGTTAPPKVVIQEVKIPVTVLCELKTPIQEPTSELDLLSAKAKPAEVLKALDIDNINLKSYSLKLRTELRGCVSNPQLLEGVKN